AESTERTESFQPHFLGEKQIWSTTVTAIHQFRSPCRSKLSVLSAHSAAQPTPGRWQPSVSDSGQSRTEFLYSATNSASLWSLAVTGDEGQLGKELIKAHLIVAS
ncbi:MAG: hypothetical protein WA820_14825, partial [Bradyrhizobium sp.]